MTAAAAAPGKTGLNDGAMDRFLADPAWSGQPVWMLNLLRFKKCGNSGDGGRAAYEEYLRQQEAQEPDRRVVMRGYARTLIGREEYHMLTIVEYPSPAAFAAMGRAGAYAARNQLRLAGLEQQHLIPMRAGFWRIEAAAPPASRPLRHFSPETVWTAPSGLVGDGGEPGGAGRVGVTSSSREQAAAFVQDDTIGSQNIVWHLNLLRFSDRDGSQGPPGTVYANYARKMGKRGGVLSTYGARSTLAADTHCSLIGTESFDRAIIAEYPCRESYLSMGTDPEYLEACRWRHAGLEATYILS
jgi:uncharacterized protein (DUF1330 family)